MMKTLTTREWRAIYKVWRAAYAHLPTQQRARVVRGCKGKALYETAEEAWRVAAGLVARPGKRVSAYPCDVCKHWHLGNTSFIVGHPNRIATPKEIENQ